MLSVGTLLVAGAQPAGAAGATASAWGFNGLGELGDGTAMATNPTPGPVSGLGDVEAISAGGAHTLALLNDTTIVSWGWNAWGQLGDGMATGPDMCASQACSTVPVSVTFAPPLASGTTIKAVSAGNQHSLALLSDGTVLAWGNNADGELGDGNISGPDACVVNAKTYTCSPTPVPVQGLVGATAISAGNGGSLALLTDGSVMAWGNGTDVPTKVAWSPPLPKGTTVVSVSEGSDDGFALLSDGTVLAWGDNSVGQLGRGNLNVYLKPVKVRKLSGVTAISAGTNHGPGPTKRRHGQGLGVEHRL